MEIQHDIHALNRVNTFFNKQNIFSKVTGIFKRGVFGYFGMPLSNNDLMIKKINCFFKGNLL